MAGLVAAISLLSDFAKKLRMLWFGRGPPFLALGILDPICRPRTGVLDIGGCWDRPGVFEDGKYEEVSGRGWAFRFGGVGGRPVEGRMEVAASSVAFSRGFLNMSAASYSHWMRYMQR